MTRELPALTGIRGLAAAAVVAYHYRLLPYGWIAVDVFFVLSGYVLSHVYRNGLARGEFLWARFARTIPTHLVATAMVGAVAVFFGRGSIADALVNEALIYPTVNPPTWSLIVEWSAYIVFALVAPLPITRRLTGWQLFSLGYILAAVGMLDGGVARLGEPALIVPTFLRGIGWFMVGMGLYRLGVRLPRTRLLDGRLALWLGDISYPMYLVHVGVIYLTLNPLAGIPATIGLAVLLHHAVEVPGRRWLRRIKIGGLRWQAT